PPNGHFSSHVLAPFRSTPPYVCTHCSESNNTFPIAPVLFACSSHAEPADCMQQHRAETPVDCRLGIRSIESGQRRFHQKSDDQERRREKDHRGSYNLYPPPPAGPRGLEVCSQSHVQQRGQDQVDVARAIQQSLSVVEAAKVIDRPVHVLPG